MPLEQRTGTWRPDSRVENVIASMAEGDHSDVEWETLLYEVADLLGDSVNDVDNMVDG